MRSDAIGLFWEDLPPEPKEKVEKYKPVPPPRTWEEEGYLPGLEEARRFDVELFTDQELYLNRRKEELTYDVECYPNYFCVSFMGVDSGKVVFFEMDDNVRTFDREKLRWVIENYCIVGFNSNVYDIIIVTLAIAGKKNAILKNATNQIIQMGMRGHDVLRSNKVKKLQDIDHIDVMEVAPLRASLKIYSGRLHARRMQDLPFKHDTNLNEDQKVIVLWYNVNDLRNTRLMRVELKEQIALRVAMSAEYGVDLRSRSDAQVAEHVISAELTRLYGGHKPAAPDIMPGTAYRYRVPPFLQYKSATMQWVLELVRNAYFVIDGRGVVRTPDELKDLKIQIGGSAYRMGIGGLHSSEERQAIIATPGMRLFDRDVASYYPAIILNLGLFPQHLGSGFLTVYRSLVERRLAAKKEKKKNIAESLKITINGSFGKLGSPYSLLYSPDLLIQVTITGQLSLLMLIERLELAGIRVVSANTDGIAIYCREDQCDEMYDIITNWEIDTKFQTEETEYWGLFSRDVNNYVAVKKDLTVKTKGEYANPWSDPAAYIYRFHKNPAGTICADAIAALLTKNIPLEETIRGCTDIRKFVCVRKVKGGAWKAGEYLGVSIRWYYAKDCPDPIINAENGHRVPKTEGAKALMELSDTVPEDLDYDWYVSEAESMLIDMAFMEPKEKEIVT